MRLLHSRTAEMKEFLSEDDCPPYAILSHTWGSEEISFQQWASIPSNLKKKEGYMKIKYCSKQAKHDRLEWIWADTCCIDKTSSAELSEAINAMFRWYANAAVCYVYLSDVQWCSDRMQLEARLSASRWFTRGWTLQELIAPSKVVFYSAEWREMGTKSQLCRQISSITGIEEHILNGGDLEDVCVAMKMSWASNRKTARTEDIAYCLLGIFDVNMPLIYGEGRKAFLRLQHEIMRSTTDQSLFAWGTMVESLPGSCDMDQVLGLKAIDWVPPEGRTPLLGLLAESPSRFKSCGQYSRLNSSSHFLFYHKKVSIPTLVDNGIMVSLVLQPLGQYHYAVHYWDRPQITQVRGQEVAVLFCHSGPDQRYAVGLPLRERGEGSYARTQELVYVSLSNLGDGAKLFREDLKTMHIKAPRHFELEHGDIIFRRHFCEFENTIHIGSGMWYRMGQYIIQTNGRTEGELWSRACRNGAKSFTVFFRRIAVEGRPIGALWVGATYVKAKESREWESDGLERIDEIGGESELPMYHHTMAVPFDFWVLKAEGFPCVYVKSRRMPLGDENNSVVDVVDLVLPKHENSIDFNRMANGWNQDQVGIL